MSKHCLYCNKKFGLVRRGVDFKVGTVRIRLWDSKFCSDTHENLYVAERAEGVRVLDFRRWLYARPP